MQKAIAILAVLALSANAIVLNNATAASAQKPALRGAAEPLSSEIQIQKADAVAEHKPPQQRMRVLSDLHLGGCWAAHNETRHKLVRFLKEMADPAHDNGPPITNLVLLGDLWDWWLVPVDKQVPQPHELFQDTDSFGHNIPETIEMIKNISKRMKVYIVRGNHDDINSKELTTKAFGEDANVEFMEDGLELNGVWMEHGNIFDIYSTVPRKEGEPKKQGFSYFVTRTQALPESMGCKKAVAPGKDGPFHDSMAKALNNQVHMLEHFEKPDFASNPAIFGPKYLESLVTPLGPNYKEVAVVGMNEDGLTQSYHSKNKNYTLGDAIKDHKDDGKKMLEKYGEKHTQARLLATGMDNARMYSKMNKKHLVFISGHTHFPYVERVQRDKSSKVSSESVYANSGAWTFDNYGRHLSSYVDVTFDQVEDEGIAAMEKGSWRPSVVKYYEYPEKEARESAEVPIPKSNRFYGWEDDMHPDKLEMVLGSGSEGIKL